MASPRPARARVLAALVAALALAGCRDEPPRAEAGPSLLDLVEAVEPPAALAAPALDGAVLAALPPPTDADGLGRWHEERARDAAARGEAPPAPAARVVADEDGARTVRVSAAAGALHREVALAPAETCLVTARLRTPPGSGDAPAGLRVVSLAARPPDEPDLARPTERRPVRRRERTQSRWNLVLAPEGGEWQELSAVVPPLADRHGLLLSVLPGDAGVEVAELVVRRLTPAERLAVAPRRASDRSEHPLRRRVRVGDVEVDALALPAGEAATLRVPVPADGPRLRAVVGLVAGAEGAAASLALSIDGEAVAERALRAAPDAWTVAPEPWSVPLERWAGREVELALAATGAAGDVVVVGAPRVLASAPEEALRARPSVLLLSLDTLRADHVGCYGGPAGISPAIDALAAAGTRFDDVVAVSSYTLPTHASLLTGQLPFEHGAYLAHHVLDPDDAALLPLALRERGYATAAFTGGGYVDPSFGFGVGFDAYGVRDPGGVDAIFAEDAPGGFVPDAALQAERLEPVLAWLGDHADVPFLLFVHTYFVHNYVVEPRYLERFEDGCPPAVLEAPPQRLWEAARDRGNEAAARHLGHLYAASVAQADERIVRPLLAELERLGIADTTVVALVSDHGEELGEHGSVGHGGHLGGELTRVPLVLRGPGVPAGEVRDGLASQVDLAPTLRALLDLPRDPRASGRALLGPGAARGGAAEALLHVDGDATEPRWDGLVAEGWKLLRADEPDGARLRLHDFGDDPLDQRDLAADEPEVVARLHARLEARVAALEAAAPRRDAAAGELDAALRARLEDLGYVGGE